MREIKFKGYGKFNNTWYYGLLGKFDGKYYIECEGGAKPFVEEDSIGQYTGFADKNGKEIYEGDELLDNFGLCQVVKFNEKTGSWETNEINDETDQYELYKYNSMCEVIGNIYEEKLKEDK